MNKRFVPFICTFVLFFLNVCFFSAEIKGISPAKRTIMIVEPDIIFPNTIESLLYSEIKTAFENEEKYGSDLFRIKDKSQYRKYLEFYDLDDRFKLSQFYNFTNIDSSVSILTSGESGSYRVKLIYHDFIYDKSDDVTFYLKYDNVTENVKIIKSNLSEFINRVIDKIDFNSILKNKKEKKDILRNNNIYEFILAAGAAYHSRDLTFEYPQLYSPGISGFLNISFKIYKFNMFLSGSAGALLHGDIDSEIAKYKDDYEISSDIGYTIPHFTGSADIGVFLPQEIFRIGLGVKYCYSSIYSQSERKINKNGYSYYSTEYDLYSYDLILPFISFAVQPDKNGFFKLDIGSFFSPGRFYDVYPSFFFPLYLKTTLNYYFYKDLFFDLEIPFYMINFEEDGKPVADIEIAVGLGWRIKWGN